LRSADCSQGQLLRLRTTGDQVATHYNSLYFSHYLSHYLSLYLPQHLTLSFSLFLYSRITQDPPTQVPVEMVCSTDDSQDSTVVQTLDPIPDSEHVGRFLQCYLYPLMRIITAGVGEWTTDSRYACLCGVVHCRTEWCGVVWCGVVWCGVVWCGVLWCGVV
jgi:hypothetical protein